MADTPKPQGTQGNPLERMVDELQVQAWLARAEMRHPSMGEPEVREEVSALATLRDELRVQLALGKLQARDEWHDLENRWLKLKSMAEYAAQDAGESLHDLLKQIRDGYQRLMHPA